MCGVVGAPQRAPAADQERAPRVVAARSHVTDAVRKMFADKAVAYPPARLFLRAFKKEAALEMWAGPSRGALTLVKTYAVCASSGTLGPKRQQGDQQVPEGFYKVNRFNPVSNFHLSLGLDYPNASDRIRGHKAAPGGDIFIHGDCVTIGCLPLTDALIEEVYVVALDARSRTRRPIDVHIFPARMDEPGWTLLRSWSHGRPELLAFWEELRPAYLAFEQTHQIPDVRVNAKGAYAVRPQGKPTP